MIEQFDSLQSLKQMLLFRVETISYMESVLLGDPFEFLSRWPPIKLVSRLPSLALCHQVYSACPTVRQAGHCVTGATGILLFYR